MKNGCEKFDLMPITFTGNQQRNQSNSMEKAYLMMDVVIVCVVEEEGLKGIEREAIAAMVVDSLHGGEHEEHYGLANSHEGDQLCECCTDGVQEKAFERMVVQRAVGVGYIQPMVHRMDMLVQELVDMEEAMEEILPGINHKAGKGKSLEIDM